MNLDLVKQSHNHQPLEDLDIAVTKSLHNMKLRAETENISAEIIHREESNKLQREFGTAACVRIARFLLLNVYGNFIRKISTWFKSFVAMSSIEQNG